MVGDATVLSRAARDGAGKANGGCGVGADRGVAEVRDTAVSSNTGIRGTHLRSGLGGARACLVERSAGGVAGIDTAEGVRASRAAASRLLRSDGLRSPAHRAGVVGGVASGEAAAFN